MVVSNECPEAKIIVNELNKLDNTHERQEAICGGQNRTHSIRMNCPQISLAQHYARLHLRTQASVQAKDNFMSTRTTIHLSIYQAQYNMHV